MRLQLRNNHPLIRQLPLQSRPLDRPSPNSEPIPNPPRIGNRYKDPLLSKLMPDLSNTLIVTLREVLGWSAVVCVIRVRKFQLGEHLVSNAFQKGLSCVREYVHSCSIGGTARTAGG